MNRRPTSDHPSTTRALHRAVSSLAAFTALLLSATPAAAQQTTPDPMWITSGEVGVGPVDDDVFLHLTPRLTHLRPVPLLFEEGETLFETSLHVPLRLRLADREPTTDNTLRREDWTEATDYFRILRRIEYGSPRDPAHLKAGELGPARLGHGTILDGYYNVITTDHYRLGLTGHVDRPMWGAELIVDDLTSPALLGARSSFRPPELYEEDSSFRRFSFGMSVVTDVRAPTDLESASGGDVVAGPGLEPAVAARRPAVIAGLDARWDLPAGDVWNFTPYTDFNHHFGQGSGLHTGTFIDRNFADWLRLSTRLEYRLLMNRYAPVYVDPVYEITRFQHPGFGADTESAPKLRATDDLPTETHHGGMGQLQARVAEVFTLSAAFSDATGPTGADLRLRASVETEDRARIGLFYYQFTPGERSIGESLRELFEFDGALVALEGRFSIWGPVYAQGQFARQWRLRDNGRFDSVHLWNVGLGAGIQF